MSSIVEEGEFKGTKVLSIKKSKDDPYPFSFGLSKAKLILENIDSIRQFVEKNDKNQKVTT